MNYTKNRMAKVLCLIAVWACSVSIGNAQNASNNQHSFSVKEAEQYAIDHNRSMLNASLDVKKAEANRWQSIATMLPQVNASLDYSNYCGYKLSMNGMEIPMNPSGTVGLTAALALSGTQIVSAVVSKIALQMAQISTNQNDQAIRSQVRILYTSILAMEQTMSLLDSSLNNLKNLYTITENSYLAGALEQTDVDQLAIQVASMQNSINASRRSLEMLYNSMRLQMGLDVNAEITLTDDISTLIDNQTCENLLEQPFNLNNNYNYQLLAKSTELSKKQVTLTTMGVLPTVSAYYQYSAKTYFGKDQGFNMTPPNMVGLSVKIPIFSSAMYAMQIKASRLDYQKQLNSFQDAEDGLRIQERQLKYNLRSALEDYNTQRDNIDVSRRVFESIGRKFEHGASSAMELTQASTSLITAQTNYIQATINLLSAQTELENLLNQ